jgi:hypothetical protein
MSKQVILASALVLAGFASLPGCRSTDDLPPGAHPPVVQEPLPPELRGSGRMGMSGYQNGNLGRGYTGDGSLMSAGLPARGGGPVSGTDSEPMGLTPGETIGSPWSDGTERVIVDPATGESVIYSSTDSPSGSASTSITLPQR